MQTTTYTRSKLQGLAEEKRIREEAQALAQKRATMCHYVQQITPCVVRAAEESKTSYLYTLPQTPNRGIIGIGSHPTTEDLVEALREAFPGCTVGAVEEWVDHIGRGNLLGVHTRVLTSGIKIDWS
jgi:hypothetical protein